MRDHPLVTGRPEPWMDGWGEDALGPFAQLTVRAVTQRFRWIRPGTFMMGSPPTEDGRRDNEGPQHEVTLTEGVWLGETPVTQALWMAVMGENPSRFRSPRRPVDGVSWEDCKRFLSALGDERMRLPTEAEWERACRATTKTATWRGDLTILGANNAPLLDEIAWYGGNSGVGFELSNGYGSQEWPDKQHPHTSAGSRDVATRAPNPWGLHDMLGNVWEWCEDAYEEYGVGPRVNPWVAGERASDRVLRGGSWSNDARFLRAACRFHDSPDDRYVNFGFRLVRGQVLRSSQQGAERGRAAERHGDEGRGTRPEEGSGEGRP